LIKNYLILSVSQSNTTFKSEKRKIAIIEESLDFYNASFPAEAVQILRETTVCKEIDSLQHFGTCITCNWIAVQKEEEYSQRKYKSFCIF